MAWMGTRDIYAALGLTAVFTILSDYLFNEDSSLCIVPQKYRVLEKLIDTNEDGVVNDVELNSIVEFKEQNGKMFEPEFDSAGFSIEEREEIRNVFPANVEGSEEFNEANNK